MALAERISRMLMEDFDPRTDDGDTLAARIVEMIGEEEVRVGTAIALLRQAQPHICSLLCPSVWKTGEQPPHSDLCQSIQKALAGRGEGGERGCD